MTWEEYRKRAYIPERWEQIKVECPKCGKNIYVRTNEIGATYISNMPRAEYKCRCGWYATECIRLPDRIFKSAFEDLYL